MEPQLFVLLIAIVFFIACFFIKGVYDEKRKKYNFRRTLKTGYGDFPDKEYKAEQYANICKYYLKHQKDYSVDDITWNDLDLDSVFIQMNHTYSSAGEEYLYYRLRTPEMSGGQLEHEEEIIRYFMEHEEERINMQIAFAQMGKTGKYSLYDYLEFLDVLGTRTNQMHIIMNLTYLLTIALIFVNPFIGICATVGVLCYSMISYSKEKSEIEPYITSLNYVLRVINGIDEIEKKKIDIIQDEINSLSEKKQIFRKFAKKAKWLQKGSNDSDPLSIIYIYFNMMFHIDLIVFNSMLNEVKKHVQDIDDIVTTAGRLESEIAIGAYRASMSAYCIPTFVKDGEMIAENVFHPLISNPVKNSITSGRGVLLTGSNASGKSTFLKTIALNAILAQTIHTCMADSFQTQFYRIYSSMSLRDDLDSGDSYYIVEIKALKRIMDATAKDSDNHVLCFVDEVLRGTNTVERIAASTEIMRSLTGDRVKCFAATHDIELTELLEQLYDNYHFEEEVIDGDVVFHYQLLHGKATTRNAIKLLSIIGYDEKIIDSANETARKFLETGRWQ